ncbi:MAG: hypothetical protein DRP74_08100 [Candidatus Omnitrophota bacterium]|mgnify:CR=1 FL=1|nr:MAG: hypothetical protein DRP74_08100 [Candidatus Omnitrophota bacterium]
MTKNGMKFDNKEVQMLSVLVNEKICHLQDIMEERFKQMQTSLNVLHEILREHINERKKWRLATWTAILSFVLTAVLYVLRFILGG